MIDLEKRWQKDTLDLKPDVLNIAPAKTAGCKMGLQSQASKSSIRAIYVL